MKKRLLIVALVLSMLLGIGIPVYGGQANVTLPNFKVTMNGQVVNNDYSKYPLIVYKDITYFPMTYSDCRYLGIESTWKGDKAGLLIDATGVTAAYSPYTSSSKNGRSYTATIPSFPIKVNGKTVDNSKEQYPLLSFRNITYFPMTWKYSVEQFGWDYSFDGKSGLNIKSKNSKLQQTALPKNRGKEASYSELKGQNSTCVLAYKGYVYFEGPNGSILQAPLSDTSKTKTIYQLEVNTYASGGDYDAHSFYVENGKAMLYFHSGGATMGSDHKLELNSDGTTNVIQESYYETTAIGDDWYMYWQGPMPGPGNLRIQKKGTAESMPLGQSDYWYYGLADTQFMNLSRSDGMGVSKLALMGKELYVRAAKVESKDAESGQINRAPVGVYKVNTDTNEVTKVSKNSKAVDVAQIEDGFLYYLSEGNVYKASLQDGTEIHLGALTQLPESSMEMTMVVLGDKVYFKGIDEQLYVLGQDVSVNPKAELMNIGITGDKGEYLVCTFKETSDSQYRIMLFDKSGNVVFKTSDVGKSVVVEGNTIYYYNIATETICSGNIK